MTNLEFHSLSSYVIDKRRDFHKYPEQGWHEFRTTAMIFWELSRFGYSVKWLDDFIPKDSVLGRDLSDDEELAEKQRALREGADREVLESFHLTGLIAEIAAPRQEAPRASASTSTAWRSRSRRIRKDSLKSRLPLRAQGAYACLRPRRPRGARTCHGEICVRSP